MQSPKRRDGSTCRSLPLRAINAADEQRFLADKRPDGPVFALTQPHDANHAHVVMPTFVRGRSEGWFFAYSYSCMRDERFDMRGPLYFDPFSGATIGDEFEMALRVGANVRAEWMQQRKSLRDLNRAKGLPRRH